MKHISLRDENGKIYYGWWIVLLSALIGTFAYCGIVSVTGVFLLPVTTELNISIGAFSLYVSVMSLCNIVTLFFISKYMTQKYIKKIMVAAAISGVVAFIGFSLSSQSWHFYAWAVPMGFCFSSFTMTPCTVLISNWFGPMARGKAISFFMSGLSLGCVALINILNGVIMNFGWRMGYVLIAACIAVCVPLTAKIVVWSPDHKNIKRLGDVPGEISAKEQGTKPGITFKNAVKKPSTWMILLSGSLVVLASSAVLQHGIATMVLAGFTPAAATALVSAMSLIMIATGVVIGILCDKFKLIYTAAGTCICFAIGIVGFAYLGSGGWWLYMLVVGYVFGVPAVNVVPPLILNHMFGEKEQGIFIGYLNMFISLGGVFGSAVVGMLFDVYGSYRVPWLIMAGVLLVAALIRGLCTVQKRKFQAR